ncbi:MAG: HYR domain-containing protein, partial [Flavobacteriaceae bacterium]|nr:HYR domain-containing protein [Flavobacteriaceae bacterium]
MKKITLTFLLVMTVAFAQAQTVFINEIHYDNNGGDVNEGVEIAGPAGIDLTGWNLVPYNGSNGQQYSVTPLSGSIDDEGSGYGAVFFAIVGLQNGAPDGIALVDDLGTVIQFLSYEGTFAATNGPANGLNATDIGVSEVGTTPIGESLQLIGTGNVYTDFSWTGPVAESPGSINVGQTFTGGGAGNPPVISCPADIILDNIAGQCDAIANYAGTAIDPEDGDISGSIVYIPASGSTFSVGTTTVTLSVTDSDGNTVTCDFDVTVNDVEGPMVTCQDITVELDNNGMVTVAAIDAVASSSDNCGIASVEVSLPEGSLYSLIPDFFGPANNLARYEYNPITDAISLVDAPYGDTGTSSYSFDLNPTDGLVYLLADSPTTGNRALFLYDITTNTLGTEFGDVVSSTGATNPNAIAFATDGTLFVSFGNGRVNTLDIGTMTASAYAAPPNNGGGIGLGFDYDTNTLYYSNWNSGTGQVDLYSITPGTATLEFSFNLPSGCIGTAQGLEYVGNGKFVASTTFGCDEIYTIDLAAGTTTSILTPDGFEGEIKSLLFIQNVAPSIDFDCASVGENSVTIIVTDDNGNQATCTAVVTVEDNISPVIVCAGEASGPSVFINEIHYDNTGTDQDEAIEIAGPAGTNLSTYSLVLYNGNNGQEYDSLTLSGTIDDEGNGFGALNFPIAGIQNGSPDGIVLANNGTIIQFLSYEGSFTAVDGIATGLTSTDIGVSEPGSTPIGESLQLSGTGTYYSDFTWTGPTASSPGDVNSGQTYIPPTSSVYETILDSTTGTVTVNVADLLLSVDEACSYTVTTGGGTPVPGSITTLFATNNNGAQGGAVYFDLTVGPQDINLTDLDVNTADAGAFTLDVYTLVGTYVGNEGNAGAWTLSDTAAGTASGTPDTPSNAVLNT